MLIWDAIIEEIALEGLDGITLPTLWFRLQSRPDSDFVLDDFGKQWIWSFLRQRSKVISFFQLAEPRPSLLAGGDDEDTQTVIDERTVYPLHIVTEEPVWGSCSTLDTRLDVTGQICTGEVCGSLSDAIQRFGPDRLVVVASQNERNRVLLGPDVEFSSLFRECAISRQQYAILEKIGRSRYTGVNAGMSDSVHSVFSMRAKEVFYVIKRFETAGIIKKQTASLTNTHSKLVTASLVMLSRFSTPVDRSRYLPPMRKLISFLEGKPDRRAPFNDVKELFGIITAVFMKKMCQTFPGIIRSTMTKVEVPCSADAAKRHRHRMNQKRKMSKLDSDDSAATEDALNVSSTSINEAEESGEAVQSKNSRTVIVRHYELIGKLHLDEDTGELLSRKAISLDESETTADGGGDGDEDPIETSTSDFIDWSKHNPFRTRTFETMRVIRQAGADGVDNRDVRQAVALDRKQAERMFTSFKRGTMVKTVLENLGKRRKVKYVWSKAEHQAEQHYRKFLELTGLDVRQLPERERWMLGDRSLKRLLFILEFTEVTPVVVSYELLRPLREHEQSQGYTHSLDKKCLQSLLKFLTNKALLKTFITILKEGDSQKTVEFACHKRIELSSPELQSKIGLVRLDMARSSGRRLAERRSEEGSRSLASIAERLLQREKELSKLAESKENNEGRPPAKKKRGPPPNPNAVRRAAGGKRPRSPDKSKEIAESTTRQGWWPHPAVQNQLKRRANGNQRNRDRTQRGGLDAADEASFARRRSMRSSFSPRERQLLLLMRAVSYVFYTGSRLWVDACVIRDLMHKYIPESRDKTSKALIQSSSRELAANPQVGETMIVMAEQIQKHKAIGMIKKRLSTLPNGPKEKRWAFTKAFEIARKMFYGDKTSIDFDDIDLNTVFEEYDVSLETVSRTLWPMVDAQNKEEILENTTKRVVYSALGLSRRDGTYTSHLHMIYSSIPDLVLLRVIQKLQRNGMVVFRRRLTGNERLPKRKSQGRRGDFRLSFFYRHFFYHHFDVNLAKDSKALVDLSRSQPSEWHNLLVEQPGYVAATIALSTNKQFYFDLTVPSNVVVYNESNPDQAAGANGNDEDDDWPRVISATTVLLQSEDDEDDDEPVLFETAAGPSTSQIPLAAIKTEPGTEAVHLACQSANKSVLFKLRQERLHACESSDARSMNVRVRDLTLNSCTLLGKVAPSFTDTTASDQAKIREAMAKLVSDAMIRQPVSVDMDAPTQAILDSLNEKGAMGMTEEEFREYSSNDETLRHRLLELVETGHVKCCGVWKKRYIALSHIDPWAIESVRYSKENRIHAQIVCDSSENPGLRGDPTKFMPRPWLKPDGTLNKPMLRWLCEGLFLRILSLPSVTETYIQEQFISVMDPWETTELIQFLIDLECVRRSVREFVQRKPKLFGPPKTEKVTIVSYDVPTDATIKFAAAFERTPMPDFVTSWLTGGTLSDRGAVFGRRRMRPTALPTP